MEPSLPQAGPAWSSGRLPQVGHSPVKCYTDHMGAAAALAMEPGAARREEKTELFQGRQDSIVKANGAELRGIVRHDAALSDKAHEPRELSSVHVPCRKPCSFHRFTRNFHLRIYGDERAAIGNKELHERRNGNSEDEKCNHRDTVTESFPEPLPNQRLNESSIAFPEPPVW